MRNISVLCLSAALAVSTATRVQADSNICRALVMSGGANKGAYEAGVVHGLSHLLNNSDAYYDVVSGVSAGALNSAAIALWPKEQPKEMSEWLVDFWRKTTSDMIYQMWPGGFQEGLFNQSGIFDTSPLLNTLITTMAALGGQVQKKVVFSAVDVNTGDYITYTETNSLPEELPQRALASASIPFVFPHQHIGDRVLMDGGTVWNTNLGTAVERCKELGVSEEQITMDVIICSNSKIDIINKTGDSIENYLRYWSISGYQKSVRDVAEFRRAFPKVNYRYFFMASRNLSSGLQEMEFTPEILEPMIQTGMDDANTVVTTTKPGETFEKLDQWFYNENNVKETYPHLVDFLYA